MPTEMHKPVVFLACANSVKEGRRLHYLVSERQDIKKILKTARNDAIEVFDDGDTSAELFFDELRNPDYSQRISIIHFAGHADGAQIRLISSMGEEQIVPADTLATFLKPIESLKLVFLNGCGTYPIVEAVLQAGIPAVIATERPIDDQQAARFAIEFYKGIAGESTIRESFDMAMAATALSLTYHAVNTGTRSLDWEGKEEELAATDNHLPWGLYVQEGQETALDWAIQSSRNTTVSVSNQPTKEEERPFWKKPVSLATLGIGVVLAVLAAIYLPGMLSKKVPDDIPTDQSSLGEITPSDKGLSIEEQIEKLPKDPTFFGNAEGIYKVMIVPFVESGEKWPTSLERALETKIKNLDVSSSKAKLELKVKTYDSQELNNFDGELAINEAKALGKKKLADMVIWGDYKFVHEDSRKDELRWRIRATTPLNAYEEQELFGNDYWDKVRSDTIFVGLPDDVFEAERDILFWAKGNEQERNRAYDASLDFYKEVRDSYTPLYLRFARVFGSLNQFTKAAEWLQRALTNDPQALTQNAEVSFQKARLFHEYVKGPNEKLYVVKGRYDSALTAYNQAISLQSEYPQAYFYRGRLKQNNFKEYEAAMNDYRKGIQLNGGRGSAYVYHDMGKLFHIYRPFSKVAGRKDSIRKYYNLSVQENPSYGYIYADRGFFYKDITFQFDSAEADFRKAIELSPKYPYAYFHLGTMLSDLGRRQNDKDRLRIGNAELVKVIGMVNISNGLYEEALLYKGYNLMELGQFADAERDFNKVIQKFDRRKTNAYTKAVNQRAYTSLAILYGKQNEDREFYKALDNAVKNGFNPSNLPASVRSRYTGKKKYENLLQKAQQIASGRGNSSSGS